MSNLDTHSHGETTLPGLVISHAPSPQVQSPSLDLPPTAAITIYPLDDSETLIIPQSACTHEGFRDWAASDEFPQLGKISFIEGELFIDMSPESIEEHSEIKTEVCRVLANHVRTRKLGRLYIDGVLISHQAAKVSNEPDALFVSQTTYRSGRLTFTPEKGRPQSSKEIVGAVDWVLEIVSPSTKRKDTKLLRNAYFNAGIPEYWLIDALVDEDALVDFQILVAAEGGYVPAKPSADGWLTSPTFGCDFRLTRQRDEDRLWQYTLEVQQRT
jgi:Uma2 family endonuclease